MDGIGGLKLDYGLKDFGLLTFDLGLLTFDF